MSDKKVHELFLEFCLTKKERAFVSQPLNTRHEAMKEAFKVGLSLAID